MSARSVLKDASDCGVRVSLSGDNLAFKATVRPAPELLATLRQNKPEIISILRAAMRPKNVSDDEWLAAVADAARLGYWVLPTKNELPS